MAEYIVSCEILAGIEDSISNGELIRCKDCKWNTGHCRGIYAQFISCYKTGCPHKENWYCADAERREEEE